MIPDPAVSPQPSQEEKATIFSRIAKVGKKRLLLIGAVILLALIGIIVFLSSQKNVPVKDTSLEKNSPTEPVDNNQTAGEIIKTPGGLPDQGFQISHPSSWKEEDNDPEVLTLISSKDEVIQVGTLENPKKEMFSLWFEHNYKADFRTTFIKTNISGQEAYKSDVYKAAYIYLPNKNILSVTYTACEDVDCQPGKLATQEYEQILSSIKI